MDRIVTSRIRPVTIIFSVILLCFFAVPPYIQLVEKGLAGINKDAVYTAVMLLVSAAGLFAVFRLTLIVKLDKEQRKITFIYPFRLLKKTLSFDEITGFRYKYLRGRIDYKALQVKT